MDNFNCLKTLTEDIVKKQHYSLESLKTLCRKTNTVNSDISNLINSLQMVGNKQFAENRVYEDNSVSEQLQQRKDISSIDGPQVPVSRRESKLSSILLKAIELVPAPDFYDTPPNHTFESEDTQSGKTRSIDSTESSQEEKLHHLEEEEAPCVEEKDSNRPEEEKSLCFEEKGLPQSNQEDPSLSEKTLSTPKTNRPLDRDRVVDILKRYSLYDDDEDESE